MLRVVYVTSSTHKKEECEMFRQIGNLADGTPISSVFEFDFRNVAVTETLEVDLVELVRNEVVRAYEAIRVPCFVEHAGLIFEDYEAKSYPGGLTKPMWNALGERFVEETGSANRRAIARAVVAYCDGMSIVDFVGETRGTISAAPRGHRKFYWDTVFVPDTDDPAARGKTFSEIVGDAELGLEYKMKELSQSARAMGKLLEHLRRQQPSEFWPG